MESANEVTSLNDFVKAAVPFAGCETLEEYMAQNNPMVHAFGNRTPTLVLNALDDFLCVKENIRLDLLKSDETESYAVLVTDEGSHIAYNEGSWAQGCYMWRVTMDFFDAVAKDTGGATRS